MTEREELARLIEAEIDRDIDAWMARWTFPGGLRDAAPDPPQSKYQTNPQRIADAILAAGYRKVGPEDIIVPREVAKRAADLFENFGDMADAGAIDQSLSLSQPKP